MKWSRARCERLVDIGSKADEHSAAFPRCATIWVDVAVPARGANEVKDHVDAVLIHKCILRYIVKGKLAGWAGGMLVLKLRVLTAQELFQRVDGQEIQCGWDDDVDVDFAGKVEDVQWMNIRVCCAVDGRCC